MYLTNSQKINKSVGCRYYRPKAEAVDFLERVSFKRAREEQAPHGSLRRHGPA